MGKYILRRELTGYVLYVVESNEIFFANKNICNIYDEESYTLLSHNNSRKLPEGFFKKNVGRYIDNTRSKNFFSAPETVFIEVTKKCNLRCKHCFNDSGKELVDELDLENIFRSIDKLYDVGIFSVKVTGGEPFVRGDILEIFEYLDKKDINFIVYSNGTCITPSHIQKLKDYRHLQKVRISVDGNKVTNDAIRGNGLFERAISIVKELCNNGIKCEINYTITKNNYFQIAEVAQYLKINQVTCGINIGMVKIAGRVMKCEEEYYFTEENIEEAVQKIKQQIQNTKVIKSFYLLEPLYYQLFGDSFGCPAARLTMTIKSNGDVFPCGLFSEYKELLCGNMKNDSFYDIWNSGPMNKVRQLLPPNKCVECEFYMKKCTGACRGNALNYFGNICGNDINCFVYQIDFNEGRKKI